MPALVFFGRFTAGLNNQWRVCIAAGTGNPSSSCVHDFAHATSNICPMTNLDSCYQWQAQTDARH